MIKKIFGKIDFLWKGDRDMLLLMWASILLAAACIAQLAFTIWRK